MGKTGYDYAPTSKALPPVVEPGQFAFSVAALDHGHIYGQTNGLRDAGGTLKQVWDPDPVKVAAFVEKNPGVSVAGSLEEILADEEVQMVTSAAIPCDRAALGVKVMRAGKHYFTDKSPFTTMEQLVEVREVVWETGKRYFCYFSERLHNESSMHATKLLAEGAVGEILQVICLAPHRLSREKRPDWFFEKDQYGGILIDIGSHQFEQVLTWTRSTDATIHHARVANFTQPDKPGLEDFGETSMTMSSGASCYVRTDWLTPDGLRVWGDGRVFIVGTAGTMEIRKYTNVAQESSGNRIFLVTSEGEQEIECEGTTGFPFFGEMILDCLNGTGKAMTQEHIFKSAELSMRAQALADGQASPITSYP